MADVWGKRKLAVDKVKPIIFWKMSTFCLYAPIKTYELQILGNGNKMDQGVSPARTVEQFVQCFVELKAEPGYPVVNLLANLSRLKLR